MKIPLKFQVFDQNITLSDKDAERLTPCLGGWNRLNELFLLSAVNEGDLRRMIMLELLGGKRRRMLDRLLMRLGTLQRQRIREKITKALR